MKKLFVLSTLFLSSYALMAQASVDEIVSKHIEAIGGAENWKKVNSVVMVGSLNVGGTDVGVTLTQVHNQGSRQDISLMGMSGYRFTTQTSGYSYMPFQGQQTPEPVTAEEIKEGIDDLDLQGNLLDYKAKGHSVSLLGTEEVEGTECYKLKVVRKNSGEQTLYIDKDSYLLLRSIQKRIAMGQEMDLTSDFSDYREVNGIKLPYAIGQGMGTVVISSIKINEPVATDAFANPK